MPPVGASAISFSARWHRPARRARVSSPASRSSPNKSDAAAAMAPSMAAELDSPAPMGTDDEKATSMPPTSRPARWRAQITPAG